MCGKQFSHRERGLELVREVLSSQQPQSRKDVTTLVKGCCQVLKKALSDKVFAVSTVSRTVVPTCSSGTDL